MEGEHNQLPTPPPDSAIYRPTVNITTLSEAPVAPKCDTISVEYDIAHAVICAVCFVFGVLYCFFGYRFFKATMFLTGFIFGGMVTYLICLEEQLLPFEGKIGVAVAAGILCGLITMLVQYVGIFMTGFHLGLLLGIGSLCIMDPFYQPTTKWICIGILFGGGLVFALLGLYFQKSVTILGTSIFGAALLVAAVDYFVEMFAMVLYVWQQVKAEPTRMEDVCWYTWVMLGMWPATMFIGVLAQWKITARRVEHKEPRRSARKRYNVNSSEQQPRIVKEASHQKQAFIPSLPAMAPPTSTRVTRPDTPSRYRHLYQVRRVNGDVIAQSYMESLQPKFTVHENC